MYVVSKGGTFGVLEREYITEDGVPMVVIRWGPLGWLTPVSKEKVRVLFHLCWESEARNEAVAWVRAETDALKLNGMVQHDDEENSRRKVE